MNPTIAIVHKDRDSAYGMSFPDAPGGFSAADEIDDLFANATEALELWTDAMREEGFLVPEPRALSQLLVDPEWTESFATAVLLIAVEASALLPKAA